MKKISLRVICSFYVSIICMAGCGQTGPLYLPEQAKSAAESAKASTDASDKQNISAKKQSAFSASQTTSSQASQGIDSKAFTASSASTSSK